MATLPDLEGHRGGRRRRDSAVAVQPDLRLPDGRSVKEPRYYQRVAIERALYAILNERRRRILLTLATGTGKTFVALQIIWKLWSGSWRAERKPRILYLADRNILVDQPIAREFQPVFGEAVWKIRGGAKTIVFCVDAEHAAQMRQALANANADIVRSHPDYVVRIVSDEGDTGRLHLGDFADPERETPVIATTASCGRRSWR